jgi:hypothetical protein
VPPNLGAVPRSCPSAGSRRQLLGRTPRRVRGVSLCVREVLQRCAAPAFRRDVGVGWGVGSWRRANPQVKWPDPGMPQAGCTRKVASLHTLLRLVQGRARLGATGPQPAIRAASWKRRHPGRRGGERDETTKQSGSVAHSRDPPGCPEDGGGDNGLHDAAEDERVKARLLRQRRLARSFENTLESATGWLQVACLSAALDAIFSPSPPWRRRARPAAA